MEAAAYRVQTRLLFHSHIKIKLPCGTDDRVFGELFEMLEQTDRRCNSYCPASDIDRVNRNPGRPVSVDPRTADLMKKVVELSGFFDGRYDITVMPLLKLWGFYKNSVKRIPTETEIMKVKQSVGYERISIGKESIGIAKGQEIVTGSFIKAYAVDLLREKLLRENISDAVINAGGSTIMALNDEGHPFWKVTVDDPVTGEYLFTVDLSGKCFSTSCQSGSFVEIRGKRYGHVLNASTGYPSPNRKVCIISDNCLEGDVISTGLLTTEPDDFVDKAAELSAGRSIEGFLIDHEGTIVFTPGFREKYINNSQL